LIYKAVSASTGGTVAVKLAKDESAQKQLEKEHMMLESLHQGKASSIVDAPQLCGDMLVMTFYKDGDPAKQIEIEAFARDVLHIPAAEQSKEKIVQGCKDLVADFKKQFNAAGPDQKAALFAKFRADVSPLYASITGTEESRAFTQLLTQLEETRLSTGSLDEPLLTELQSMLSALGDKIGDRYITRDLKTRIEQATHIVGCLKLFKEQGVFHGDIKPANFFSNGTSMVLGDFDGVVRLETYKARIDELRDLKLSGKDEADALRKALKDISKNNVKAIPEAALDKLESRGLITTTTIDGKRRFAAVQPGKEGELAELARKLSLVDLPADTPGFGSKTLRKNMEDAFWRGEYDNFVKAAYAFDRRAMGVALYQSFCAGPIPYTEQEERDPQFYDKMKQQLEAAFGNERRETVLLIMQMCRPPGI
jgi:serine/threonine protein kinase